MNLKEVLAKRTGVSHWVEAPLAEGETVRVPFRFTSAKEAKELRADWLRMAKTTGVAVAGGPSSSTASAAMLDAYEGLTEIVSAWLLRLCPELEDADAVHVLLQALSDDGYDVVVEGLARCAGIRLPNLPDKGADSAVDAESETFPVAG